MREVPTNMQMSARLCYMPKPKAALAFQAPPVHVDVPFGPVWEDMLAAKAKANKYLAINYLQ